MKAKFQGYIVLMSCNNNYMSASKTMVNDTHSYSIDFKLFL